MLVLTNCGIIPLGRVGKKNESSEVYLFREQSHLGRVIVAHKKHVSEITELTSEERAVYIKSLCYA